MPPEIYSDSKNRGGSASAGSLVPRAGRWIEAVKRLFGGLLIAVALWLISPVLPVWARMLAWAVLFIVSATEQHQAKAFAEALPAARIGRKPIQYAPIGYPAT